MVLTSLPVVVQGEANENPTAAPKVINRKAAAITAPPATLLQSKAETPAVAASGATRTASDRSMAGFLVSAGRGTTGSPTPRRSGRRDRSHRSVRLRRWPLRAVRDEPAFGRVSSPS